MRKSCAGKTRQWKDKVSMGGGSKKNNGQFTSVGVAVNRGLIEVATEKGKKREK